MPEKAAELCPAVAVLPAGHEQVVRPVAEIIDGVLIVLFVIGDMLALASLRACMAIDKLPALSRTGQQGVLDQALKPRAGISPERKDEP